jgi:2',3'-cyclic-nucleotide 2'-phosphodiesterase (5'-nucleotidase family)
MVVGASLAANCATAPANISTAPPVPADPAVEEWVAPGGFESPDTVSGRKRLRVLGINDFHGNVRPHRPAFADGREVGGAAALATYFRLARQAVDAPTVLIDGGDTMQGTPLSNLSLGRATVDFYNNVGFHAAALGNHEFDWGVQVLRQRMADARFPWLSANLWVAGTDTLPSWVRGSRTLVLPGCAAGPPACDSVRVGVIGLSTTATPRATLPSHVAPYEFVDEAETIDRYVPTLRAQGVDFVIVTIHEGGRCSTETGGCSGPIFDIAARLHHRPDLIVSGHSHTVLNTRAAGVPIVQSGAEGSRFSIVDLERVSLDSVAVYVREQPVTYTDRVLPDSAVTALLAPYLAEFGPLLAEEITRFDEPLLRQLGEHPLGNLIADAQRRASGAEITFMNNGGIRTDLRAGPVTYEHLFRLQPFANTLVTMDLSGEQLIRLLEQVLSRGRPGAHVSGLQVRYAPGAAAGARVRAVITEDGRPLDRARAYRVAVNNFLAEGGDGLTALLEGSRVEHTGIVDLEALIAHLRVLPRPPSLPAADRFVAVD